LKCTILVFARPKLFTNKKKQSISPNMSDNIIVKAVAGTCVTFSFILAGRQN
jgi:hypothetical protein